ARRTRSRARSRRDCATRAGSRVRTPRRTRPDTSPMPRPSCAEPQLARRRGRERMMRGDDRHAAARDVVAEQALEEPLALVVERGERLVERPERHALERKPREPDAPALARGQPTRLQVAALVEANTRERGAPRSRVL